MLDRAAKFLATTSELVQRTSTEFRHELQKFERDTALAKTAKAMRPTPGQELKTSAIKAALAKELRISNRGSNLHMEIVGEDGGGAAGVLARAEFERILQMLKTEVAKAGWISPASNSEVSAGADSHPKIPRLN